MRLYFCLIALVLTAGVASPYEAHSMEVLGTKFLSCTSADGNFSAVIYKDRPNYQGGIAFWNDSYVVAQLTGIGILTKSTGVVENGKLSIATRGAGSMATISFETSDLDTFFRASHNEVVPGFITITVPRDLPPGAGAGGTFISGLNCKL